jgi:hypothetical protein
MEAFLAAFRLYIAGTPVPPADDMPAQERFIRGFVKGYADREASSAIGDPFSLAFALLRLDELRHPPGSNGPLVLSKSDWILRAPANLSFAALDVAYDNVAAQPLWIRTAPTPRTPKTKTKERTAKPGTGDICSLL